MENSSLKEEYKPEDMLLFNINYNPCQQEEIDDKDSNSMKSCNEKDELIQNGRWRNEEHIRFIKGCLLFANNWKKVKKYVRTRSSEQIRSHAQKYLIKLNKKYPYSLQNELKDKDAEGNTADSNDNKAKNYNYSEVITNIINSLNTTNLDMETVEQAILARFKFNGNDKPFQTIVIDDLNIKSQYSSTNTNNKENKKKSDIFSLIKVSKRQRKEELKRLEYNRENNNSDRYSTDDQVNYNQSTGQFKDNKIIYLENFIHSCLNSYDPNDLTKLLTKFNNDPDYGGATTTTSTGTNSLLYNYNDYAYDTHRTQENAEFTGEHLSFSNDFFDLNYNLRDIHTYFNYRSANEIYENNNNNINALQFNSFSQRAALMNKKIKEKDSNNVAANVAQGQMSHIEGKYIMGMQNENNHNSTPNMNNSNTQKQENLDKRYGSITNRTNYHYPFNITYYNGNNNQSNCNHNNNNTTNTTNTNRSIRPQSAFTQHSSINASNHLIGNLSYQMQNSVNNNNRIFKAYHN